MQYTCSHIRTGRASQHLSVRTDIVQSINGSSQISFDFVPGPGRHLISYGSRWFFVERQREHQVVYTFVRYVSYI